MRPRASWHRGLPALALFAALGLGAPRAETPATAPAPPTAPAVPAALALRADHGLVPRVDDHALKIDGRLDEPLWSTALAIEVAFETSPADNGAAPVRTVCLLAYSERHLFVGFRADDPAPALIRAHLTDRDQAFRNDYVGLILDPFNDGRRGFNFMVNPLGVQMDATTSDVSGSGGVGQPSVANPPDEDFSWDAIWASAGRITAHGYEVEFAIPFSSLRFPRGDAPQTWGVLPFRAWPRATMFKLRSVPRDRDRNCFFCQLGTVGGLAGMIPGRNLELVPTATASRTDRRPAPGAGLADGPLLGSAGISARWGVTPNLSLNAALNPDFSQIEADAAQLSVNRRFALFFPEKRPFFLEGADLFAMRRRVVSTRTVADPLWGLKLSGKDGPHAYGVFVARDRVTNLLFPGAQESDGTSLEQENTTAVARVRRDVGQSSAVGAIATLRDGGDYRNAVGGVDGLVRVGGKNTFRALLLHSETRYPQDVATRFGQPQEPFSGSLSLLTYSRSDRNWAFYAEHERRSRGLRADAGFIAQVDSESRYLNGERLFWGDGSGWFNQLRFGAEEWSMRDGGGAVLDRGKSVYARYEGPWQSTVRLTRYWADIGFAGRVFDGGESSFFYNIRPNGALTHSLEIEEGQGVDFETARPGRTFSVTPGITWNIGRHLFLQVDHEYERFRRDGTWLYKADLTQLRAVYQFNTRFFVRAIAQRSVVERNPQLLPSGAVLRDESLLTQYLASYKVNPQTVVFVGLSGTRDGRDGAATAPRDRTFFVKLGYAWVL